MLQLPKTPEATQGLGPSYSEVSSLAADEFGVYYAHRQDSFVGEGCELPAALTRPCCGSVSITGSVSRPMEQGQDCSWAFSTSSLSLFLGLGLLI